MEEGEFVAEEEYQSPEFDSSHLRSTTDIFISISGDERSNKTKLLSFYLNSFNFDTEIFNYKLEKSLQFDNEAYKIHFLITTGFESHFGSADSLFRKSQGTIFVYNINSRESFDLYLQTYETINKVKEMEHTPLLIIGFGDPKDRKVSTNEGQNAAQTLNCKFKEIILPSNEEAPPIDEIEETFTSFIKDTFRFYSIREADTSNLSSLTERHIMVIGDSFTGKTTLIKRIVANTIVHKYVETDKITQYTHKFNSDEGPILLHLYDTPGLITTLSREFMEKIQGIIMIFSVTSKSSYETLKEIREKVLTSKGVSKIPSVLIATKCDALLRNHQLTENHVEEFSDKLSCPYQMINRNTEIDYSGFLNQLMSDVKKSQSSPIESVADLDRTGQLQKTSKNLKKFKQKYFIIRDGILYCSPDGLIGPKTPKISLLNDTTVELLPADPAKMIFPFEVRNELEKPMFISAPSEEERKNWTGSIIANIAYGHVANSLIDDVVRVMLWETINALKFSKEPESPSTPVLSRQTSEKAVGEKHSIWSKQSKSFASTDSRKSIVQAATRTASEDPTRSNSPDMKEKSPDFAKVSKRKSIISSFNKLSDRKKKKDK